MTESEIVTLVSQWRRTYGVYYKDVEASQKLAFDYWIGRHRNDTGKFDDTVIVDNLIFEAVETFLPIATKASPESLVQADPSKEGQKLASDLKNVLSHEADVQHLRRKLARTTRSWLLNRLGGMKVCWDLNTKSIVTEVTRIKDLIFDKDGYINEHCQFVGCYIGEKKKATAEKLCELFPKKKELIIKKAQGKMGTKIEYIEWWYNAKDVFYTMDDVHVLGKYKNPNWNYDGQVTYVDKDTGEDVIEEIQGKNHLKEPTYPWRFLSIFSLGEQPHDNTGLVIQNIPLQDRINKYEAQIDRNVEGMNNGIVVSGTAFTEDQAAGAASALRRGVAIRVPDGDVQKAVLFPQRPGLPNDVFNALQDKRSELKNIFGTSGSTPSGVKNTDTVRGKILVGQLDASRIGGGITEYIEQLADAIFNLWVQMMFVYYDEKHYVTAAGKNAGGELVGIINTDLTTVHTLNITVKEGSLIPKDPLTQRNEAIDLWSAEALDPLSLYQKLDFPDPVSATNSLILWQMLQKGQIQPQQYLSTFQTEGQAAPQPGKPMNVEGEPVSPPPNSPPPEGTPTVEASPEAVQSQGQDLLKSVPIG